MRQTREGHEGREKCGKTGEGRGRIVPTFIAGQPGWRLLSLAETGEGHTDGLSLGHSLWCSCGCPERCLRQWIQV